MNTKHFSSIRRRQTGLPRKISLLLLLAVSALLFVLGGCGGLNDDPADGGLTVRFGFSDSGGASSAEASSATVEPQATAQPQAIVSPKGDVLTVVIGAIVITHIKDIASVITAYNALDIATISERERELLESDLEQSVVYLEIVQLPTAEDTVSFPIPPDNAGEWQLLAVGMRHRIEALDEIENNSPIYYGFIGEFLNGQVSPGQELSQTLTLTAACGIADPIVPCP